MHIVSHKIILNLDKYTVQSADLFFRKKSLHIGCEYISYLEYVKLSSRYLLWFYLRI